MTESARNAPSFVATKAISRGTRRKRDTQDRLLAAGFELMADKGVEGVTIKQITDAADVGFGSFYNHFESKGALHAAIIERHYASHGDNLDRLVAELADPAEVIAISVRHTLLRAEREPIWGRFLAREGFSTASLSLGLGRRLQRDIMRGIDDGRFCPTDPPMSFVVCAGAVLAAVAATFLIDADLPFDLKTADGGNLPQRVAASTLRVLGLSADEADRVAQMPLPAWDPPDS